MSEKRGIATVKRKDMVLNKHREIMHRGENSGEQYSVTSAVFRPWETTRGIGTPPRHRTSFHRRTDESHSFHRLAMASASALTNLRLPINCGKRCFASNATSLENSCRRTWGYNDLRASWKIENLREAENFKIWNFNTGDQRECLRFR